MFDAFFLNKIGYVIYDYYIHVRVCSLKTKFKIILVFSIRAG